MSDKKVISLAEHKPEPNAELIADLEYALAQAKAGEIIGWVGIKMKPGGGFVSMRTGYFGDLEAIGALAFAQSDIIRNNPVVGHEEKPNDE